jgi:hypothetical protein
MWNSPYSAYNKAGAFTSPMDVEKPTSDVGGMQVSPPAQVKPPQMPQWNPYGYTGTVGGSDTPYQATGPQLQQQSPMPTNGPVRTAPVVPQFNLNGMDNPRRFVGRPQMTPQQMRALQMRMPNNPNAYKPEDGSIELPPPNGM